MCAPVSLSLSLSHCFRFRAVCRVEFAVKRRQKVAAELWKLFCLGCACVWISVAMGDMEAQDREEPGTGSRVGTVFSLLFNEELLRSRKGQLLLAEVVVSFISFVCFCASTAAAFVTAPLLAFITALFLFLAHTIKFHERFKGFHWPLMDFLRCVTASIVFFIISIMAVANYSDGSSKAAGIFGFIATIIFALDFYFIFNQLADFLKGGGASENPQTSQDAGSDTDSD